MRSADHRESPAQQSVRRDEVLRVLDEIIDPCSAASATPIGLVAMGIVEQATVHGCDVTVRLLPTFPGCIFTAVFTSEIESRLGALDWVERVEVELALDGPLWDEERMAPAVREQLRVSRAERRALLAER